MLLYNAQEPTDFESYQEQGDVGTFDVGSAQIDTFFKEDFSNSRERNLDAKLWEEVYKVHDLAPEMFGPKSVPQTNPNAPKILQQAWDDTAQAENAARLSDWESMIEPNLEALKSRFPEANIRNRDEIDADIASEAKVLRDKFEKTYSYADPYAAFFGTLGGAAVASMADPINIMTLPLGAGRVAGASFIKGLGIVAARSFGIGVATEAALQPFVYDYKKEIESPYDLQDALFNMAAAGVGNGLLNGAGHSIVKGWAKYRGKIDETPDSYEKRRNIRELNEAFKALEEMQNFADETGAKTVGELEIHLKALNTAMADIEAGRQVDYDSLGKTIEAEYLEGFDLEVDGARATLDFIAQERFKLEQGFDADLYSKQEQLKKFADQKLTTLELKQAQAKADIKTAGKLNQKTDLATVREIQKADFDRSIGEDTVRQNEEANIANNDLRASRRDEGDMIALKQQMDELDTQYSEQVEYHSAAKKAREQYVVDKAEETNQAIAVAPTDTPRMMAVKTAVNRIAASMGANDIKVRVYEGNPDVEGDLRFSMDNGKGSAAWKAAEAKGLDMSQKGRMARAKAMGFDIDTPFYHGSAGDIKEFLVELRGATTMSRSAKKAFWFSDDVTTARSYAEYSARSIPVRRLMEEADAAELKGDWDKYDAKIVEAEKLEAKLYDQPNNGQNITKVLLPNEDDLFIVDFKGKSHDDFGVSGDVTEALDSARHDGFKGVKFLNLDDAVGLVNKPSTHIAVFDPSHVRSANAVFDPDSINSPDLRNSKSGNTIEAAINPETGELHINASAFRDEAHLMQVMREEIIGHYGLRKSLGDDFQGVINDIKSTALTNPELRQMWVDLSGIDPQTKQIINPDAPYKGMADDVIADEIISKMAREEISDTTFMTLKNIIIKALRKVGLIKDDITVSEMRALVVKSEQALKKNVVKQPRITGLKPQLKQVDEPLNNDAIDAESNRIVADEANDQVTFDQNGNTINLRDALMEDDNDIAGIESLKVCML